MNDTIAAVAQQVSPPIAQPAAKAPGELGKEDFMKLLIAQLQRQDPLNPQDPTEFTSQLTQYSSLEQLIGINQNLGSLGTLGDLNSQIMAMSAIGRRAVVSGDSLTVHDGQASPIHFETSRDSAATALNVFDASGQQVATVDLGPRAAGSHEFTWNGLGAGGDPVGDGTYRFEVAAEDGAGDSIGVDTSFAGLITAVRFSPSGPLLEIDGQEYSMDDIRGLELAD